MGRLHIAAPECNYQEVDRAARRAVHSCSKQQVHVRGYHKRIKATKSDNHITSRGVLAWAKRVEVQKAQATFLNILTESRQFD